MYAGAITRNPDAIAAMFTEDGVYDSPLAADDHPLRRLMGRDAIRTGTSAYHQQPTYQATMNLERSAYVLHDTADPDVSLLRSTSPSTKPTGGARQCRSYRSSASATGRSPSFATTSRSCHPSPLTTTRADPFAPAASLHVSEETGRLPSPAYGHLARPDAGIIQPS
jgi:hypothetical protein